MLTNGHGIRSALSCFEVMMRIAAVLLVLASTASSAWALDVSRLPESCKVMIEASKTDKPQFSQNSGVMIKARKANDKATFCAAAKSNVGMIVAEDEKLDQCLGELAADRTVTPETVSQFTETKAYFRKILAAVKEPANDHMKCGLAE